MIGLRVYIYIYNMFNFIICYFMYVCIIKYWIELNCKRSKLLLRNNPRLSLACIVVFQYGVFKKFTCMLNRNYLIPLCCYIIVWCFFLHILHPKKILLVIGQLLVLIYIIAFSRRLYQLFQLLKKSTWNN